MPSTSTGALFSVDVDQTALFFVDADQTVLLKQVDGRRSSILVDPVEGVEAVDAQFYCAFHCTPVTCIA